MAGSNADPYGRKMISRESSRAVGIKQHIARVREQIPSVKEVLDAFEELLLEEAYFEENLIPPVIESSRRDLVQDLCAGIPLASPAHVEIPDKEFKRAVDALFPALKKGFPSIARDLDCIASRAAESSDFTRSVVEAVLAGKSDALQHHGDALGVKADVLLFVVTRVIKPFAEKWGHTAGSIVKDMEWLKGYCPLCGSWPNLSLWRGEGGRRWLHCSFCGHEWTFMRTACPFCESVDQQQLEAIFSEDRPSEAADVCLVCRRYLLRKDLREDVHEVFPEVAALSMSYLDALVQGEGFRPPERDEHPPSQAN